MTLVLNLRDLLHARATYCKRLALPASASMLLTGFYGGIGPVFWRGLELDQGTRVVGVCLVNFLAVMDASRLVGLGEGSVRDLLQG